MQHKKSEQGQAIVLLVLLIVGLLAAAGLAVDAGRVYSARRTAQNAADNAALAAALAICNSSSASSAALTAANTNGFNNDGTSNTVTVHNPPTSGANSGDNEYVEVIITHTQPATLTQLVYKGNLTNTIRAVARCDEGTTVVGNGYALIIMHTAGGSSYSDPYDRYTLKSKPGGIIRVTGTIFVNSDSPDAYSSYGHQCGDAANYGVQATAALVVGGEYEDCANYLAPNPTQNASAITDPLATLAAPTAPGGTCTTYTRSSGSASINPGKYCSITLTGTANVTLNAGEYYITGDLRVADTARMTANNALLYLSTGDITFEDSAIVSITAPSSGTFKGMSIFMDSGDIFQTINNANVTVTGTVYAPNAFFTVYGLNSGSRARFTATGSQLIVDSAWIGASSSCTDYTDCTNTRGDLTVTYNASAVYGAAGGSATIELSE